MHFSASKLLLQDLFFVEWNKVASFSFIILFLYQLEFLFAQKGTSRVMLRFSIQYFFVKLEFIFPDRSKIRLK